MHSRPMRDDEGDFSPWQPATTEAGPRPCRACDGREVYFRTWESHDGAYEDTQYHCRTCGRRWWVEGDDA
jgi:DNA-directed RNA polymerase subunit M/transcription elongation factor TFIIS